jgi:phosphatidylserine/phosphatidylglycerophosphate/cardiolipin synthase-like enzyme
MNRIRRWIFLGLGFALAVWMTSCGPELAWTQAPAAGVYYSPSTNLEQLDVAAIHSASGSISMAAYALTDKAIVAALAERAGAGVKMRIYRDRIEVAGECRGDAACPGAAWHELLGMPNVEIKVKRSTVLMHLKAYSLSGLGADGTIGLLTREGSANFSPAGEMKQDNSAIYSTDPKSGASFATAFRAMWDRADNLTVAQAVATAPKWGGRKPGGAPTSELQRQFEELTARYWTAGDEERAALDLDLDEISGELTDWNRAYMAGRTEAFRTLLATWPGAPADDEKAKK